MYVHNYVPDPIEVPGNVTQEKYPERLAFIRRVSALHAASIGAIVLIALAPLPQLPLGKEWLALGTLTLILSLVRIALRGARADLMVSVGLLPAVLVVYGMCVAGLLRTGFPIWSPGVGLACAVMYAMLCGRDFSFVGQYLLSLIASTAAVSLIAIGLDLTRSQAAEALAWNGAYLLYYVYDLASLLARRRKNEELGAVVDLYRDVFNIFGWIVRVLMHWRRHRIWTLPPRWS